MRSVVVCHPESLIARAIATSIEEHFDSCDTVCTSSLSATLSSIHSDVDFAVIFDGYDEDTVDLFEAIRHRGMDTPVLMMTQFSDPRRAAVLLESGAAGVLSAQCGTDELCEALEEARRGTVVIDGTMRAGVLEALRLRRVQRHDAQQRLAALRPTDREILRQLCDGQTVAQIARRQTLSLYTVRGRLRVIGSILGTAGQLKIAAVGRRLLADALPAGDVAHD